MSGALLTTRTGVDALRVLDEAGIEQGALLSEAYMFESPFARSEGIDSLRLTRQENAYNVEAAIQSNGRLKAFIGVNPLADNALDEMNYWRQRDGVSGVKLHLGNSGFRPESPGDVVTLANFFGAASRAQLPVIIHVRHDRVYTQADVQTFIQDVLPHAGDIPVQMAHAGGHGGIDAETICALTAYADAIEHNAPGSAHWTFDLAAVGVLGTTDTGSSEELLQSIAAAMRRVGLSRFVMGSDWPSVCSPLEHNELVESQLPLTAAEWLVILKNRAPYLT